VIDGTFVWSILTLCTVSSSSEFIHQHSSLSVAFGVPWGWCSHGKICAMEVAGGAWWCCTSWRIGGGTVRAHET
jgi:hypothetical protein